MDVVELCRLFQEKKLAKSEVDHHIHAHWGGDDMKYKGRSFFSVCEDLIEEIDVEDCMCHGFLDLTNAVLTFIDDAEENRIADMEAKESIVLIFCK